MKTQLSLLSSIFDAAAEKKKQLVSGDLRLNQKLLTP